MDVLLKQIECFMDNAANAFELADARNECQKKPNQVEALSSIIFYLNSSDWSFVVITQA